MYIQDTLLHINYRVRYAKPEQEQFFPAHFHDGYEILYIASGGGECFIEGERFVFGTGDLIITNPNEVHSIRVQENSERWYICFRSSFLSEFVDEKYHPVQVLQQRPVGTQNRIQADAVQELGLDVSMRNILTLFDSETVGKERLIKANLLVLLHGIEEVIKKNDHKVQTHELADVVSYINTHFTENITVEEIAKCFFLSKSQLSHTFSKYMGISLKSYITKKRVIYAKELMSTSKKLTQIAFESGFGDYSAFYRAFKRATGLTPLEYKAGM